jgi:hypothetical protein
MYRFSFAFILMMMWFCRGAAATGIRPAANRVVRISKTSSQFNRYERMAPATSDASTENKAGIDLYVSSDGNDKNTGSEDKPLASLHSALRKARELRRLNDPSIHGGIRIMITGGLYSLNETVVIRPEDSGTAESPTEIIGIGKVVFSGGLKIGGWKKVTASLPGLPQKAVGKVWSAGIPDPGGADLLFRQMWVNGQKAIKARYYNGDQMGRILSWNAADESCQIPLPAKLSYTDGMEMLIHQWWAIANLRIKSIKKNKNAAALSFMQPESRIQSEHPWPAPWISKKTGNSAFNLSNSIQFLDEAGEWFEDFKSHRIYYWPKPAENMKDAEVVVPFLEQLLQVEGTPDHPVAYISFKGISFQHSSWLRPSRQGHVPHQTGMYMLDAYKLTVPGTADKKTLENQAWVGRPAAALEINYANHIDFKDCRFEHHAATALDYGKGAVQNTIEGNLFKDIGGSAISMGTFSDEATEVHLPYQPKDLRVVSGHTTIQNNLITDVTNEDWGTVGIAAGYVRGLKILHNDISELSYSGISMGWGWTKTANVARDNVILGNKIHHYGKQLYDVAGIYTLSAQPGSLIAENEIDSIYKATYAHLPNHWFYLYTDEGSAGFTVKDNWTPNEKYLQNANGPGNTWKDNGPGVSALIRKNAGLGSSYRYMLREKAAHSERAINSMPDQEVLFELTFREDSIPRQAILKTFAAENNLKVSDFYRWGSHLLIYTSALKVESLQPILKRLKPLHIKLYEDQIYKFSRVANCGLEPAAAWDHIILSANLVADQKLQEEYLNYHKTQFERWPELSRGFCNAEFQQVLIYKNDRQLMLIISIPKGKSLNELNPKTTLNNPKVDEWNALMKKYQEGIAGTQAGEVWVEFKPYQ